VKKYCQYCQKEVINSLYIDDLAEVNINIYFCNNCNVEYLYFDKSDTFISKSIYTSINNIVYRWVDPSFGSCQLIKVCSNTIPDLKRYNLTNHIIIKCNKGEIEISPSNINKKVKNILLLL